jgi:hypothetical protein
LWTAIFNRPARIRLTSLVCGRPAACAGLNKKAAKADLSTKAAPSRWLCQDQPPARPFFAVVVEHRYRDSMWHSRHTP